MPYSFRLDAPELNELKSVLDDYLSNTPGRNNSQRLINLVRDGLASKGLIQDVPAPARGDSIEDIRNDLRYELENSLKGFVMDLLKDSGRMAKMNQVSESIANGEEIGDDILDNILEGLD